MLIHLTWTEQPQLANFTSQPLNPHRRQKILLLSGTADAARATACAAAIFPSGIDVTLLGGKLMTQIAKLLLIASGHGTAACLYPA